MIEDYAFGSITILGRQYRSDLKIINGEVVDNWWRKTGHAVDVDDVTDILDAQTDCVVFGTGKTGLMKVSDRLRKELAARGVELIAEPSPQAMDTFNRLVDEGRKVAAGFHLTC